MIKQRTQPAKGFWDWLTGGGRGKDGETGCDG